MTQKDYKNSEAYKKGLEIFHSKYEKSHYTLLDELYKFSPALADVIVAHGLYEIWEEKTPNLSVREKEIAVFSSLVTSCTVHSEIKAHAQNLLNVGMTKEQVIELAILLTLYIGVPKIVVVRKLLEEAFAEYDSNHSKS